MDALIDLIDLDEPNLRSKTDQWTPQETQLIQECRVRLLQDFFVGTFGGAFVGWRATKRLNAMPRIALCVGAAATTGAWLLKKSIESSVEHILSLQGTRVQRELASLMLKNNQNNPWVQKHVFKYFYPEVVYTDSSVDGPVYSYRYRHFFGDPGTPQSTPQSEETDSKPNDVKMTAMATKQAYVNAGDVTVTVGNGDPFDLILGHPESAGDVRQPNAPRALSRRHARREKRQRRRHMRHHQEESEI